MKPPFKPKLTVPYRPWHTDKIEPYAMQKGEELSNDPMFRALLGPGFRVAVDFDFAAKRITYSLRTADHVEE